MGGKALTQCDTQRMSHDEYVNTIVAVTNVLTQMKSAPGTFTPNIYKNLMFDVPQCWPKPSYGDIDIVVTNYGDRMLFIADLRRKLNSKQVVTNGDCTSFEFKNRQIDLIFTQPNHYDWTLQWYSWGDCSALIGRMSSLYNLKFKNDGLYYKMFVPGYTKKHHDVLLTTNYEKALEIVGYKQQLTQGVRQFSNNVDVYNFLIQSSLFSPAIIFMANQRNGRKMQDDFDVFLSAMFRADLKLYQVERHQQEVWENPTKAIRRQLDRKKPEDKAIISILNKADRAELIIKLKHFIMNPHVNNIRKKWKKFLWMHFKENKLNGRNRIERSK